ncbi:DUF202 domain-containing protein [Nocardia blacklockiae]|uniref:DUF202 domain-containing protein n=1 Tax=Nocardia blacklockiae TaxID=480036 RepID=UPI001892F666|nr:DUF202 domain-containing protein [Nocardia blacklockiae]MBF6174785.1 DUF202 domain-containing protein [Nocardia blacklockiae]
MTAPTLAAERTALAWRRTAVAAMGTAALFVHQAIIDGWRAEGTAPLAGALTLLVIAAVSYLRNRSLRHGNWGHDAAVIRVATAAIAVVAVTAALITLAGPPV